MVRHFRCRSLVLIGRRVSLIIIRFTRRYYIYRRRRLKPVCVTSVNESSTLNKEKRADFIAGTLFRFNFPLNLVFANCDSAVCGNDANLGAAAVDRFIETVVLSAPTVIVVIRFLDF